MVTSRRPAPRSRPSAKKRPTARRPAPRKPAKAASKKPVKPAAKTARRTPPPPKKPVAAPVVKVPELEVPLPGGRRHILSLSFVRDGDEFLARLETDAGHITELKNRSLDQLLTLVASELEDVLE